MTNYLAPLTTAHEIAEKYSQPIISDIKSAIAEYPDFKVTAPIVGGFSTGKSSLLNSVIGEHLLSTDITPETALPAEITYGSNAITLIKKSGGEEAISVSDFAEKKLSVIDYSLVKINTESTFFSQLKSLKVVDMPGFDSGYEIHNRAIDCYLPNSLAYVITIAADEGTLRESIINFLKELKIHEVEVYVVITKFDKAMPEVVKEVTEHITDVVKRYLGINDVKVAATSSKKSCEDNSQFKAILLELEQKSTDIKERYFKDKLAIACTELEKYLEDRLKKSDLSEESLKLEKEQLEYKMNMLQQQIKKERETFNNRVEGCVSSIEGKVQSALNASTAMFANMLMREDNIDEKINAIVRNTIASGIKTDLEPLVKKYVSNVTTTIQDGFYGTKLETRNDNSAELGKQVETAITPVATEAAKVIAQKLAGTTIGGIIGSALGPIGTIVGTIIGTLIGNFISSKMRQKQENENRELAHREVKRVIAQVMSEVNRNIENTVSSYVAEVNEKIEDSILQQKSLFEKSIEDCESKIRLNADEREREMAELTEDLNIVRGLYNGN